MGGRGGDGSREGWLLLACVTEDGVWQARWLAGGRAGGVTRRRDDQSAGIIELIGFAWGND